MGFVVALAAYVSRMVSMPGESYAGPRVEADAQLVAALRRDVTVLATDIGERNLVNTPAALERTASWLTERLTRLGYEVKPQSFQVGTHTVRNLIVEVRGATLPNELVVVGAHYDTAEGTPGADDNGSGVAVALSLAEYFSTRSTPRTLRFIFFTNEEPPFFRGASMGSDVSAKASRAASEDLKAMLSLETMGYFDDAKDTQHYPWPFSLFYPSTGGFIAFVADTESRELIRTCMRTFRQHAKVASAGASVPASLEGIDWSDHGPYWRAGYRALMVTDTAPFRNPHYHRATDTPDRLDYTRLAHVTSGLRAVIDALATPRGEPVSKAP